MSDRKDNYDMKYPIRIAALLTCHNRRDKTRKCLSCLSKVMSVSLYDIDIFLTDDGSIDGTSEMIKKVYPFVHLLDGDGNLFWSRGMYTAWQEALKGGYDYFLWLNDDVVLYPFFIEELLECHEMMGTNSIISGLIEDESQSKIIYGGTDASKKSLQVTGQPEAVTNMNGNVVLVPQSVVKMIGIIDPVFHHDLGDVDYGLTALEHGIGVYTTRKAVASGYTNNYCRVREWGTNVAGRYKKLYSPLGSNPGINFYFRRKHYGILNAVSYWIYLHFLNTLPDTIISALFGDKYK